MGTDIAKVPPIVWAAPETDAKRRAALAAADERRVTKVRAAEGETAARPAASGPAASAVSQSRLTIEEDEATGAFVYRIIDQRTGEVLRQWPREDMLRMQQAIRAMRGAMLDRRV